MKARMPLVESNRTIGFVSLLNAPLGRWLRLVGYTNSALWVP